MADPIFYEGHISEAEIACPCCNLVWPDLRSNPIYSIFFAKLENLRAVTGFPILINKGGGCRCPRYQRHLIAAGKTEAMISPHYFMAIDWDVSSVDQVRQLVKAVNEHYPDLRIGYAQYLNRGQTFVHLDEVYLVEFYPQPIGLEAWAKGTRW